MQKNPLYKDIYPDILAAFGAYYRDRVCNEYQLFRGSDGKPLSVKSFLDASLNSETNERSLSQYFEGGLQNSLHNAFYEFLFLAFPELQQVATGENYIQGRNDMPDLTQLATQYQGFFADLAMKDLFDRAKTYIKVNYSKLPDNHLDIFPDGEEKNPLSSVYRRTDAGFNSGSELLVWGAFLRHGLGDSLNVKTMVRAIASLDIDTVRSARGKVGQMRLGGFSVKRDFSLIVDGKLDMEKIKDFKLPETLGCPARDQPSQKMKTTIERYFPDEKAISLIGVLEGLVTPAMISNIEELKRECSRERAQELNIDRVEIALIYDHSIPPPETEPPHVYY